VTTFTLPLNNKDSLRRVIHLAAPDFIIYAAGSNDRKYAEEAAERLDQQQAAGLQNVFTLSAQFQPKILVLSNGYVFSGQKGDYQEDDTLFPGSQIGKAKANLESFIQSQSLNYVILRSAPCFGKGFLKRATFFDRVRDAGILGRPIALNHTEVHNFLPVKALCDAVPKILESGFRNDILHYGGKNRCTEYELGLALCHHFGWKPNSITPENGSATEDFSLNFTKAVETLKLKPLLLKESFELLHQEVV
jgi:dTDP-4-dehydrorhamnose reductase